MVYLTDIVTTSFRLLSSVKNRRPQRQLRRPRKLLRQVGVEPPSMSKAMVNPQLIGGLEHGWIIFPYELGMSSSQLTFTHSMIFQRGRLKLETTNLLQHSTANHVHWSICLIHWWNITDLRELFVPGP